MTSAMDDARHSLSPHQGHGAAPSGALPVCVPALSGAGLAPPLGLPAEWRLSILAGIGGALALYALLAFIHALQSRPRVGSGRRRSAPPHEPRASEAWLHVVSGADPARVAHAVTALAGGLLEGGGRVLILDGGRRLDLHQCFGRDARWGMGECLADALPVLGVVQETGCAGLYLLARGAPSRAENWPQLGRLLDEARPHFRRVVLALDPAAPRDAGAALVGQDLAGWWAGAGALPRSALALSERIGIGLSPLSLYSTLEESLEVLFQRAAAPAVPLTSLSEAPRADASLGRILRPSPVALGPVLDCELRVRERLRFLLWMQRIRTPSPLAAAPVQALAPIRSLPANTSPVHLSPV